MIMAILIWPLIAHKTYHEEQMKLFTAKETDKRKKKKKEAINSFSYSDFGGCSILEGTLVHFQTES